MLDSNTHSARLGGILLIAATLLSALSIAHHPSVGAHDIHGAMDQLQQLADMAAWVHGILIALMLVIFYCYTEYALQRGIGRPLVRAGLVFYGAGTVAEIGAACISGWVTAKVPGLIPSPTDADLHTLSALINYSYTLNQTLANLGIVAMSAGYLAWGIGLVRDKGWPRIVGTVGILAGLLPALGLLGGLYRLDVHGIIAVMMVQALFSLGIGALLIARKV